MVSRKMPHIRAPIVTPQGTPTKVFYDLLERFALAADSTETIDLLEQIGDPDSDLIISSAGFQEPHSQEYFPREFPYLLEPGVQETSRVEDQNYDGGCASCNALQKRLETLELLFSISPDNMGQLADVVKRLGELEVLGLLQKTSFGELQTAKLTPAVQVIFPYNINTEQVTKYGVASGTVTWASNMVSVQSGAAASSSGILRSRETVKYCTGNGLLGRFTAIYTTGVANNEQIFGVGNSSDGFFFGYNGTSFGVLHRKDGEMEIRTLTLTVASSHTENVTVKLSGVDHTVPVTNSAIIQTTASEIAAFDYSASGWIAKAVGAKVIFTSLDSVATLTGTYSLTGGTSAVGTFAQTVAGVLPTDSWVAQASWSEGTPVDVTYDWTKGNVFQIQIQYLGFGQVSFWVENPLTGEFHCVHKIKYANANTAPSFSNPTLYMYGRSKNSTNATNITLKTASMALFVEGEDLGIGPHFSQSRAYSIGNTTDEKVVMTLRNKEVFQSRSNRTNIQLRSFTFSTGLQSSSALATFRFYVNGIPLANTSYTDNSTNTSVVEYDVSATTFSTTNASLAYRATVGTATSFVVPASDLVDRLSPGETLLVTCQTTAGHASNAVAVSLNWVELF